MRRMRSKAIPSVAEDQIYQILGGLSAALATVAAHPGGRTSRPRTVSLAPRRSGIRHRDRYAQFGSSASPQYTPVMTTDRRKWTVAGRAPAKIAAFALAGI